MHAQPPCARAPGLTHTCCGRPLSTPLSTKPCSFSTSQSTSGTCRAGQKRQQHVGAACAHNQEQAAPCWRAAPRRAALSRFRQCTYIDAHCCVPPSCLSAPGGCARRTRQGRCRARSQTPPARTPWRRRSGCSQLSGRRLAAAMGRVAGGWQQHALHTLLQPLHTSMGAHWLFTSKQGPPSKNACTALQPPVASLTIHGIHGGHDVLEVAVAQVSDHLHARARDRRAQPAQEAAAGCADAMCVVVCVDASTR